MARKRDPADPWYTRKGAAEYLTEKGSPVTPRTLEKMAANNNKGKGPAYNRTRWKTVRYHIDDLDAWRARETTRVE